jgi:hypothetical protein
VGNFFGHAPFRAWNLASSTFLIDPGELGARAFRAPLSAHFTWHGRLPRPIVNSSFGSILLIGNVLFNQFRFLHQLKQSPTAVSVNARLFGTWRSNLAAKFRFLGNLHLKIVHRFNHF